MSHNSILDETNTEQNTLDKGSTDCIGMDTYHEKFPNQSYKDTFPWYQKAAEGSSAKIKPIQSSFPR